MGGYSAFFKTCPKLPLKTKSDILGSDSFCVVGVGLPAGQLRQVTLDNNEQYCLSTFKNGREYIEESEQ